MPVIEQTPVKSSTANGVTTVFPYDFKILDQSDLLVTVDGVTKTITTDYSVSGVGSDSGGNVTFVSAPASGALVVRSRNMAYKRDTDYQENGDFLAATVDNDLDRIVMQVQQLAEAVDRSVKVGVGSGANPDDLIASIQAAESSATASALAADASADAAAISEANAAASAVAAAASAASAVLPSSTKAQFNSACSDGDFLFVGDVTASPQIFDVDASVAGNALTVTINAQSIAFRSTTLTDGTPVTRTVSSPISMTVSSGSTLGTVNATAARLAVLAIDNAGTVEAAIVNLSGGTNLDETTLISTTAEGGAGAADSASVVYSTTARTNVAFRVVGFIDITEATAGTWTSAPTKVQGAGGNSTSMASLGYGQTLQNVTASRALGTTYYNTTGRPIAFHVSLTGNTAGTQAVTINGNQLFSVNTGGAGAIVTFGDFIVGAGESYQVTAATSSITANGWWERR